MTDTPVFSTPREAAAAAHAARKTGDIVKAAAIYRSLPKLFPGKESLGVAAGGLRACGAWSEAVLLLERATSEMPGSSGLVLALAEAYLEKQDFAAAIELIDGYLAGTPDNAAMWASLGNIYARKGDGIAAERAFAQSLSLDPMNLDAVLCQGDSLYKFGRTEEALAAFRRAIVLNPEDARGHFKLGSALAVAPDPAQAKATLLRAIELDPSNAAAYANLAGLFQRVGRLQSAIQAARQAIELDPQLLAAYSVLGNVLLEGGEFAAAAAILRIAAELAPETVLVLTALATAENAAGDLRAAERILQRILTIEPDNLEARHMLSAVNGEPVRTVPAGYSRQLFNWYAPKFDRMLAGALKYRAPEDVAALLAETRPDPKAFKRFLDIGCGTGLVAEALAKQYALAHQTGVDVAEKMIEVSRQKGLYDDLIHGDAAQVLAARPGEFDLIAAVDLFIYVGDLGPLMPLIAGALAPGGMLAYSVELLPEGRYKLLRTGRFAHARKYVEELARTHGLMPLAAREVTLRMENAAEVRGLIGLLQKS